MSKKHMACVVVFLVIICMAQGTLWMNNRMVKMQTDASRAEQKASNSSTQLAMEKRQFDDLQKNSKELIDYLHLWQPHFAAIDSPQNAELKFTLKIKEDNLVSLSQRYEVAGQKNPSLPKLMRAQFTFEDNYSRLLNWIGKMEAELPTMRINSMRISKGTIAEDLKVDLVMEQPIINSP